MPPHGVLLALAGDVRPVRVADGGVRRWSRHRFDYARPPRLAWQGKSVVRACPPGRRETEPDWVALKERRVRYVIGFLRLGVCYCFLSSFDRLASGRLVVGAFLDLVLLYYRCSK